MKEGEEVFKIKKPIFSRGRVLKLEMLESIRDYPRDFADVFFSNYSEGIICGCEINVYKKFVRISRGIIKHNNKIYVLEKEEKVECLPSEKINLLKIKFLSEKKSEDFSTYKTEIILDEDIIVQDDEMELCRFKLKKGAQLRNEYLDFKDMNTEYDTLSTINTPYSAPEKSTLNPYITKFFAEEANNYPLENPYDIFFCMNSIDSAVIGRDKLIFYITKRLDLPKEDYSNSKIYEYLCVILDQIKSGKKIEIKKKINKTRTIMVD